MARQTDALEVAGRSTKSLFHSSLHDFEVADHGTNSLFLASYFRAVDVI
jgi:hypothetical protein